MRCGLGATDAPARPRHPIKSLPLGATAACSVNFAKRGPLFLECPTTVLMRMPLPSPSKRSGKICEEVLGGVKAKWAFACIASASRSRFECEASTPSAAPGGLEEVRPSTRHLVKSNWIAAGDADGLMSELMCPARISAVRRCRSPGNVKVLAKKILFRWTQELSKLPFPQGEWEAPCMYDRCTLCRLPHDQRGRGRQLVRNANHRGPQCVAEEVRPAPFIHQGRQAAQPNANAHRSKTPCRDRASC